MPAQRQFTMSAIGAVIAIRQYLSAHPEADADSAATAIRRSDADFSGSDFSAALKLHAALPSELIFQQLRSDLRECLAFLILENRPWWMSAIPYGRDRVAAAIGRSEDDGRDEFQSLRAAGLFDEPVSEEAVQWWDRLAQTVRADTAYDLLMQGREAERLSLLHERTRLALLGIEREPRWVSIDDNNAGFDIQSYDAGSVEPVHRLIEVKSSYRDIPRMILTRGEWDAAKRFGDAYVFHLWHLPKRTLIEKTVLEIAKHVPTDQGNGSWLQVEIEVT